MTYYRCAHCGTNLGEAPQDQEPICLNHPDGVVEIVENDNTQPI